MRIILSLIYAPIVFFSLRYYNTPLEDALMLKVFPLLLSSSITLLMILSYIKKKSMILSFAIKFSKKDISNDEKEYIHKSTIFWIIISSINVLIHLIIFINTNNSTFWTFYSSIGWYILFIGAGVLQYLHRKFIFLKRIQSDA